MPDQLLKNAHSGRRIPESTFNEVATILQSVLDKNGMEKTDIDSIIQIVASHKNSIVELPTFTRTHNQ